SSNQLAAQWQTIRAPPRGERNRGQPGVTPGRVEERVAGGGRTRCEVARGRSYQHSTFTERATHFAADLVLEPDCSRVIHAAAGNPRFNKRPNPGRVIVGMARHALGM